MEYQPWRNLVPTQACPKATVLQTAERAGAHFRQAAICLPAGLPVHLRDGAGPDRHAVAFRVVGVEGFEPPACSV